MDIVEFVALLEEATSKSPLQIMHTSLWHTATEEEPYEGWIVYSWAEASDGVVWGVETALPVSVLSRLTPRVALKTGKMMALALERGAKPRWTKTWNLGNACLIRNGGDVIWPM